jgi:hypothetical protein
MQVVVVEVEIVLEEQVEQVEVEMEVMNHLIQLKLLKMVPQTQEEVVVV